MERASLIDERNRLIAATAAKTKFLEDTSLSEEEALDVKLLQEKVKSLVAEKADLATRLAQVEALVLEVEAD